MGYLATHGKISWANLCRGIQYASVVAAQTIEDFGPARLTALTMKDILRQTRAFEAQTRGVRV